MNETLWHKFGNVSFWRRDFNGNWMWPSFAQAWRRKRPDGKWEYRQDEEIAQEWLDRQV